MLLHRAVRRHATTLAAMKTPVKVFAPHWGSAHLSPDDFIARVTSAGFDGIEMSLPVDAQERDGWTRRIRDAGLDLIAQQWETAMVPNFHEHKAALEVYLRNAAAASPLFINTHTGKDFYSFEQNSQLLELSEQIAQDTGVRIVHEIHRSRFSGHPMLVLPYLDSFPDLELNADLSHWCVACESLLDDQSELLQNVIFPRVRHIHARVGHAEGPQVTDFRAPEHADAYAAHLSWWDTIVKARNTTTITPEFGPAPTMTKHDSSVQRFNVKKVKLHRKKRTEMKNQKKVFVNAKGDKKTVGKPPASKKKVRRDTKRAKNNAKYEQDRLVASGLVTKEDIEKLQAASNEADDIAE
ncbi:hypothetical protein DYB31_004177 [Aphanomyces astaci]|uniref:Xylose isomerase-like TIM barrel domain-containing protein n=1 Tax=Aphanomyces astaci TaxID=112090 RepID=A0A397FTF8_APHAT|nr:hypothetical protein DYB31_004177 [Aphanomyces astaci]